MEEPIELIIAEPSEADQPLLEKLEASDRFRITAVVSADSTGVLETWFENHGIERAGDLAAVSRLLPGMLLVYLGTGVPGAELARKAVAYGLAVLGREPFARLLEPWSAGAPREAGSPTSRFRRLMEDYFPTSRSSSTAVKMAACLTEATIVWNASGGAILVGRQGDSSLSVAARRGLELPADTGVRLEAGSVITKCFQRNRHEVHRLDPDRDELLPGVRAASAACLSVKPGTSSRGVLAIWSDEPAAFSREDITDLSLFAYYAAMLLEVDDLGDRLGENLVTDPLTGLQNRRQFDRRLREELLRAARYTLNVSLLVLDIDGLASYNDACGQMLGNLALSDIASILLKGTREVDFVARIGGDEFAAILPETNRLGALRVAERLRSEIASYPFPAAEEGASGNLTVSVGISNFPSVNGGAQDILEKAMRALGAAKAAGRDTITLWDETLECETGERG